MSTLKHVVFVCTGNICRSPMAEGLFRRMVEGRGDIRVSSAGLGALHGQRPSPHAVEAVGALGVDIASFQSKPLTERLVASADYLFAMTRAHFDTILLLFPEAAEKTFLLREFLPTRDIDVPDPIGQGLEAYRRCRDAIREALEPILHRIDHPEQAAPTNPRLAPRPKGLRVAIGADHAGVKLKRYLVSHLADAGHAVDDRGAYSEDSVDYPDFAAAVCREVAAGASDFGVLICTTGIGMSIAANRFPGIRAALVHSEELARIARDHNDANVLCLAGATTDPGLARRIAETFFATPFSGGERHERRVGKLATLGTAGAGSRTLTSVDPDIARAISREEERQRENIELIASENFTSRAVMEAQGSVLTNKYAEGYPGRRWYGGCEHVDVVEQLAIDRAKLLFGAEHANVQPHSGSQANMAVYFSVLEPGDRILTMDLSHGGHLTHGNKANFSGRFFRVTHYGVDRDSERIDYDGLARLAEEVRPKMITAGASAYPRLIDFARMRAIADSVGAYLFVDMAHIAGLVAGGMHPSPVPVADFVTTTTHKSLRGPRGGLVLCRERFAKGVDSQLFPGIQGGPLMHVIAAKAVCFHEALQPDFRGYQQQIVHNARALAARLAQLGWRLVSGGTDNHLMLVDLRPQGLNGRAAQEALDRAGLTVNKNSIPFDTEPVSKGGGIRIGTPAATSRGMKEEEMMEIADLIHEALGQAGDPHRLEAVRARVLALTRKFPLP